MIITKTCTALVMVNYSTLPMLYLFAFNQIHLMPAKYLLQWNVLIKISTGCYLALLYGRCENNAVRWNDQLEITGCLSYWIIQSST